MSPAKIVTFVQGDRITGRIMVIDTVLSHVMLNHFRATIIGKWL